MQVDVEGSVGVQRRYKVNVPSEDVSQKVRENIRRVNGKLKVPGYRPGHVPEAIVRRNKDILRSIHSDVLDELHRNAMDELVSAVKGTIVHLAPDQVILDSSAEKEGLTLSGELEVFLLPEKVSPYGIVLSSEESLGVSDEEIKTELSRLCLILSSDFDQDLPSDTTITAGDFVKISMKTSHPVSGMPLSAEQIVEVEGENIPEELNRALSGHAHGETFEATIPLSISDPSFPRGTRVERLPASLTILEIQRRIPLTMDKLISRMQPKAEETSLKEEDVLADIKKTVLARKVVSMIDRKVRELRKEVISSWGIAVPEKRIAYEMQEIGGKLSESEKEDLRQLLLWRMTLDEIVFAEQIHPDYDVVSREYQQILSSKGEKMGREINRQAADQALEKARRVKMEEIMLRRASFGGSELFFGQDGYFDQVGFAKFGVPAVPPEVSAENHDHDHDHDHSGHNH